jgi:hypothetical protein
MREAEVAALVTQGMTNRQIATALFGSSVLRSPQGGLVFPAGAYPGGT